MKANTYERCNGCPEVRQCQINPEHCQKGYVKEAQMNNQNQTIMLELANALMNEEEKKLQDSGAAIQSIKSLRARLNIGLVAAKKLYDARLEEQNSKPIPCSLSKTQLQKLLRLVLNELDSYKEAYEEWALKEKSLLKSLQEDLEAALRV